MPFGSSVMRNSECSPAVLRVTHDFLWVYHVSFRFPLFQAEAPDAWVAFTSLFPTFPYSYCLPCIHRCILYFWEMHEMCVLHVAPIDPLLHFLFFPNTSSCNGDKPTAQWAGPVAAPIALNPTAVTKGLVCKYLECWLIEGRMTLIIQYFSGPVACALHRLTAKAEMSLLY